VANLEICASSVADKGNSPTACFGGVSEEISRGATQTMNIAARRFSTKHLLRLVIQADNGLYWTGRAWSTNQASARLYHGLDDAAPEIEKIRAELDALPVTRFECRLVVEVRDSDREFTLDALKWFLSQAIQVQIDHGFPGPESLQNALISCHLDWESLGVVE